MVFMDKRQILIGATVFIIGSILFWFSISNQKIDQKFFKALYFVGITLILSMLLFERLATKVKQGRTTKDKVVYSIIFLLSATALYFVILYLLKLFK